MINKIIKNCRKTGRVVYLVLLVLMIITTNSCSKSLDLAPTDALTDATFWNTSADFRLAANGFYFALPGHGASDANSDITYENGPNSTSRGTNTLPDTDNNWRNAYSDLRDLNKLIVEGAAYEGADDISRWIGEAKFFRAYTYFNLVKRFGDVPYYDAPVAAADEEALQASRTSREQVILSVIQDLKDAAAALPPSVSGGDLGRITKGAANALLARVGLFEGTWVKYHGTSGDASMLINESITAAEAVISGSEYELFEYGPDLTLSHYNSYMLPGNDSSEQILARRFHPDVSGHPWGHWLCCGGRGDATKKLADMYLSVDGLPIEQSPLFQGYDTPTSEWQDRDYRMSNTLMVPGSYQINRQNRDGANQVYPRVQSDEETGYRVNKLMSTDPDGFIWGRNHEFKHILKYSEVLLTLAEALYERDGSISDTDLSRTINLLRDRGGVVDLTNAFAIANSLNVLDEIRRERTVELAYDGFRLDDLRRWKTAVAELGESIRGIEIGNGSWDAIFPGLSTSSIPVDSDGFIVVENATSRVFSDKNYLSPIPAQQIRLNPNLEPNNSGW